MKKSIQFVVIVCLFCYAFLFTGCSTRTFNITCQPDNSLILQGSCYNNVLYEGSILGMAPLQNTITFIGKDSKYYFAATKRGFYTDTIFVTRDSALAINLQLQPLVDADTTTFNPARLKGAKFVMLPVLVDVYLHKGVGNLDSYEYDKSKSDEATRNLDMELQGIKSHNHITYPGIDSLHENGLWTLHSAKLRDYLLDLNCNLLNYYPVHPSIKSTFWPVNNLFEIIKQDSSYYLVYTYCKTIKPTAGRVVGNVAATVASGAVEGYQTAMYGYSTMYYNADAFAIDNNTLIVSFVICPETGKVLFRKDIVVGYDITGEKKQKAITGDILGMMQEFEND